MFLRSGHPLHQSYCTQSFLTPNLFKPAQITQHRQKDFLHVNLLTLAHAMHIEKIFSSIINFIHIIIHKVEQLFGQNKTNNLMNDGNQGVIVMSYSR